MLTIKIWIFILILVLVILAAFAGGFFTARAIISKYMEKNPPINEKMIRIMFQQMGRTPSEKQIRQIMNQMKQAK